VLPSKSLKTKGRLIVIGDVHGCIDELEKLFKKVSLKSNDQVLFLGDLINKGPNPKAVLGLAREIHALSITGNHEYRLLRHFHNPGDVLLKPYEQETLNALDQKDWNYISSMTLHMTFGRKPDHVFVHGGFLPKIPWQKQSAEVVTHLQKIDAKGNMKKRREYRRGHFWTSFWDHKPHVVYGHTPRKKIYRTKYTLGIDTGCVWGGKLTAWVLQEDRIVQVKAKKCYIG